MKTCVARVAEDTAPKVEIIYSFYYSSSTTWLGSSTVAVGYTETVKNVYDILVLVMKNKNSRAG